MTDLAFVDVETTGLVPVVHEIIEIGVIRVTAQLEELDWAEVQVKPSHPETADPEALQVNGRGPPWGGYELAEALEEVRPYLVGADMAGHFVEFDRAHLRAGWASAGVAEPQMGKHTLDTVSLAWPLLSRGLIQSRSLRAICTYLGISNDGAHSALVDARRSLEVARRLMRDVLPERCDGCGLAMLDFAQRNGQRLCVGCVSGSALIQRQPASEAP